MKKAIIAIVLILAILIAYKAGYRNGFDHVIEDSAIWTVDRYDPENPEESAWNGYDQLIYIEIDGEIYEHGMIQC